jgi:zinc protease
MKCSVIAYRFFTFAFALAISFIGANGARAQDLEKPEKVATIEGITEYRYKNGLRFLSYPDPSSPAVTINMVVLVGSRHEGYGETGMAHLLEHMLFKGSKLYPTAEALDKAMQAHGVDKKNYNATTWVDRTNYYARFPASDVNLEFGLKVEADMLQTAFIRREDLAKEMTVVRQEFENGENNPFSILNQRMMAAAYEWHNYGKSTIGNRSDIERVPIDKLHAFYKKYYRIDNVVLIVAGKFDEAKALAYVGKYYGSIKSPDTELEQTYTEEPAQDGERNVILRRTGEVPMVGLMYHIPAASHEDNPAAEILSMVLGETPSGRLFKALVEKNKKATSIDYGSSTWHDPGVIEIYAQVAENVRPEEVRDLMVAEVENTAKRPFTEEEVTRAVRKYLAFRERRLTKSTSTTLELAEWVGAGDWRLLFINRDRVAKLKAADINRVAAKYLNQSNRTVGMFIPSKEVARTPIPETPSIAKLVKNFKGGKAVVEGEVFDATPENIEKRVRRFTLSTGLKVAFFPKKTRGEIIIGSLNLRFGNEKSLLGKNAAAEFIGPMLTLGTKMRSREDIQDELDILRSSISASSDIGVLSVHWQTKRQYNVEFLKLLREVLREPTFPESEFQILVDDMKQGIQSDSLEPTKVASNTLARLLNPHPNTSIHYVPTFKEQLQRVAQLKRGEVEKVYREQIGGAVGELVILGDFEPDATLKQLENIFAEWKTSVPYQRIPTVLVEGIKGSRQTVNTPDKDAATFLAAMKFPMLDTDPDYSALTIGNEILGVSFTSRLWDRLRQKEGWCYGTGSSLSAGAKDKVAAFRIRATCNPDVIDKVDKGALEELSNIIKGGVTDAELKLAIKATLEQMKIERGDDASLVSELSSGLYLGRTFAFDVEFEKKISGLTVTDVNRALAAHLSPERLVIVRAGDFAKKK